MQSNSGPKDIIEELKVAGEEVKKASPLNISQEKENLRPKTRVAMEDKEEVGFLKKIAEYQKEISQEQTALEKTHREVKGLEKKLEERIEFLKKLQTKSIEINKELKEFQEGLALAKKENNILLDEIKNKL